MSEMQTKFHSGEDDALIVESVQDCTPIVERVAELVATGDTGSKDMRHAASFPNVIVEQYINDAGITFAEFVRNPVHAQRMLNDPALRAFRVWPGRV